MKKTSIPWGGAKGATRRNIGYTVCTLYPTITSYPPFMLALTSDAHLDFLEFHGFAHDVEMFYSVLALLPGTCLGIALGWKSLSRFHANPNGTLSPTCRCIIAASLASLAPRLSTHSVSTPHILISQTSADMHSEMAGRGNFGSQNNYPNRGHNSPYQNNPNQYANPNQSANSNQFSNSNKYANNSQRGGAYSNSHQPGNNTRYGAYNAQDSMGTGSRKKMKCQSARSFSKNGILI